MTPGISIRLIQQLVATRYAVDPASMQSHERKRDVAWPRQMAMALSREFTGRSLTMIGGRFGGRDHTTVLFAMRAIPPRAERDAETAEHLRLLRKRLRHRAMVFGTALNNSAQQVGEG